jgi:hypothetical protein
VIAELLDSLERTVGPGGQGNDARWQRKQL